MTTQRIVVIDGVEFVVGGGGCTTPGASICPASTDIAIVRLRIVAAHVRRKVFTLVPPRVMQKFCISKLEHL